VQPFVDPSRWSAAELAERWRAGQPFPHVILDDFLAPPRVQELRENIAREAHVPDTSDVHEVMGSLGPLKQPGLRAIHAELASPPVRDWVGAVTGKAIGDAEMRSYVYLAGSYLLPHTDWRPGMRRIVSYAYYLMGQESCRGGELDLFRCRLEGDELRDAEVGLTIETRVNRMVLFDVSAVSLHQVREVTRGARISLAGWFLA
jgi:hypothetical protein